MQPTVLPPSRLLDLLPPEFISFLHLFNIPLEVFSEIDPNQQYRYVRARGVTQEQVQNSFHPAEVQPVPLVPGLYKINKQHNINHNTLYKSAHLYGIDLGSAFAVQALDIHPHHHLDVLDMCCAPGAKFCFIGDLLQKHCPSFTLTGVDISKDRLNICKSLSKKYGHISTGQYQYSLIQQDGRLFQPERQYDRIILDAECTHEGSIKHLIKWAKHFQAQTKPQQKATTKNTWDIDQFKKRFLEQGRLEQICQLQYSLLEHCFSLLKTGGVLIYSTCSLAKCQNEDIINKLLAHYDDSSLMPILDQDTMNQNQWILNGHTPMTIRFDPIKSQCGGMFISKITKIKSLQQNSKIDSPQQNIQVDSPQQNSKIDSQKQYSQVDSTTQLDLLNKKIESKEKQLREYQDKLTTLYSAL